MSVTTGSELAAARAAAELRTTQAVRSRANALLDRARSDESPWFHVNDDALPAAAQHVSNLTRDRHPDLAIPYHSRWRHFEAGGVDRKADLDARLAGADAAARARAMIDLTVVSVLLDAGAGAGWSYHENGSGQHFARSEGLAVASFHAFCTGLFSGDRSDPLRVDAEGLRAVTVDGLAAAFQVSSDNPMVGLDGRVALLHRLGEALAADPAVFGDDRRAGRLYDTLAHHGDITAHAVLTMLLTTLSGIWLAPNMIGSEPLGDCWQHSAVAGDGLTRGWMPFHKLSQWLTYSLLEPFEWSGTRVDGLDALTGLPEYRNGGLLLDTGVLRLREAQWAGQNWSVGDELVIEWRALTVALLDELAPLVREQLGVSSDRLPLACVLEGGTWAAGRMLAQRLRGGLPPLAIISDGTVF